MRPACLQYLFSVHHLVGILLLVNSSVLWADQPTPLTQVAAAILTPVPAPPSVTLSQVKTTQSHPFHIVLDPGHGGIDTGTVHDGYPESELTLKLALALQRQLHKSERYEVTLTRTENSQTVSLRSRSQLANQKQPDLFLSLHANSSPSVKARGTEMYIFGQMAGDEESMFLAHQENIADEELEHTANKEEGVSALPSDVQVILRDMKHTFNTHVSLNVVKDLKASWERTLGRAHVHIRQAPFHVLANAQCPAVLIEVGYISNPAEVAWLKKDETIASIARALKKGLDAVLEKIDKNAGPGDSLPHGKS